MPRCQVCDKRRKNVVILQIAGMMLALCARCRDQVNKERANWYMNGDLLYAATPEGVAYRENGLRNMEAALVAKEDWASVEEREVTLAQFYEYAAQLRAIDANLIDGHQGN